MTFLQKKAMFDQKDAPCALLENTKSKHHSEISLTPNQVAIIKIIQTNVAGEVAEGKGHPSYGGSIALVRPLWKTVDKGDSTF